jgi:MoaA/NifB/PqqE/SkfB family radical SAM enzyme
MKLTPTYLGIFYTTLCNSRCTTCNLWASTPMTLDVAMAPRLPLFIAPDRLCDIYVTGGEPLLLGDVVAWVAAASSIKPGIAVTMDTNGLLPDLYMHRVHGILDLGINLKVGISLNGRPALHNKTRGLPEAYERVIRMGELLQGAGALWKVNQTMVSETAPEDVQHVHSTAERLGSFRSHVSCEDLRRSTRVGFADIKLTAPFRCAGVTETVCLHPDGNFMPCDELWVEKLVLGNIRDSGLDPDAVDRVRRIVQSGGCQPCGNTCGSYHATT